MVSSFSFYIYSRLIPYTLVAIIFKYSKITFHLHHIFQCLALHVLCFVAFLLQTYNLNLYLTLIAHFSPKTWIWHTGDQSQGRFLVGTLIRILLHLYSLQDLLVHLKPWIQYFEKLNCTIFILVSSMAIWLSPFHFQLRSIWNSNAV